MKYIAKSYWLVAAVSGLLLMTGCDKGASEKSEEKKEVVAVPVEIAQAVKGDISAVYSNTTSLEAEEEAIVVAKYSEIVTDIFVEEGDKVEKGQVLAQLNTDKLQLELRQAEANLRRLKTELERNRQMFEKKMVSSDAYERLKYEYQAQKASYDLSLLQLQFATIHAPIEGVISQRMIKVGNMVKLNESLFQITDFDPLHAVIHVPERELNKLKANQLALVQVDARENEIFEGHIKRISPVVDANSGTFKVTVEVSDPFDKLKPGMFGRVGIVYANHKDTLLIDKSALLTDEEQPTVFSIRDNKAYKSIVETGFTENGKIEILSGLQTGDKVVIAGQNSLKHESLVEVLNPINNTEIAKSSSTTSEASN